MSPRANFQAVDYSSVFASLYKAQEAKATDAQSASDSDMYDQWQNELISNDAWLAYIAGRLAATATDPNQVTEHEHWVELQRQVATKTSKDGIAAAKSTQDALDSDTYDQWKNGLISDDEWLTYIGQRVSATAADKDPQVHAQWVSTQRQYQTSINDNQSQANFESGKMSAASYIAYLRSSLVGLDAGSSAYRDRQATITKVVDDTLASDTQGRATDLIAGIQSGKSSYEQLLALYKDALKKARPGSDLNTQLTSKISEVQDSITQRDSQGALEKVQYQFQANQLSGKAAGAAIRALAAKYFKGDQAKYYQTLESALQFEKYPGLYSGGAGKSGGSGGGGGGSAAKSKATANTINLLKANISRSIEITDQYLNNGTGEIIDPGTGQPIPRDNRTIHSLQLQTLGSYDQLIHAYESTGKATDAKQAADWAKRKTDYIQKSVQPVNTIGPAEQTQHFISSITAHILNVAKTSNDPLEVIQAAQQDGEKILDYANRLANDVKQSPLHTPGSASPVAGGQSQRPVTSQPMPDLINELNAAGQAILTVANPGADPSQVGAAIDFLKRSTGKFIPDAALTPVIQAVGQHNEAYTGLQTGQLVMTVHRDSKGNLALGPTKLRESMVMQPDGTVTSEMVPDAPLKDGERNAKTGTGEQWTTIYMNINGRPTQVLAASRPITSNYVGWTVKKKVDLVDASGNTFTYNPGEILPSSLVGLSKPPKYAGQSNEVPGDDWNTLVQSGVVAKEQVDLGWTAVQTPEYNDAGKSYGSQVWVGDPRTGTWTIGRPPVSGQLSDDGTIRIDDTGKPSLVNDPSGTAGAVPIPYVGDKAGAKVMQSLWNAGYGVGAGGQMAVDATGHIVPTDPSYYFRAYYDPELESQRTSGTGNAEGAGNIDSHWWDKDIQDIKVTSTRKAASALEADDRRTRQGFDNAPSPSHGVSEDLLTFAQSVGIRFGSETPKTPAATGAVPGPSVGPKLGPPTTAKLPTVTQPTNSALGIPAPATPTPPDRNSRTTLASLPKTTAAKISVPPPPPSPVVNKSLPAETADAQVKFAPPTKAAAPKPISRISQRPQ